MYVVGEIPTFTNGNNGASFVYPMMPYGGMGGFGGGFGGDWIWAILLVALLGGGYGFGGFGGGLGGGLGLADGGLLGYAIGNNATKGDLSDGFNSLHLSNQIEGVRDGVAGLSNQICNTGNTITSAISNAAYSAEISANNRAVNQMQDTFALSRQLCDCCCENRLATADLKSTIIQENCQDREVINLALRDVIASNTANTQAILDKLCEQEIEAKNETISNLRTQLNMQNLAASQSAQTAQLIADNNAQTRDLINRIAPYPQPSFIVGNPYYYGYNNGNNCGCSRIQ